MNKRGVRWNNHGITSCFKRAIDWNRYESKVSREIQNLY